MNLLKALATVGSMTFLSRILGFVRDTLIARVFGAGVETDAFFVAFIYYAVFLLKVHFLRRLCRFWLSTKNSAALMRQKR